MKKGLLFALMLMAVALSGCSSRYMQPADAALAERTPGPEEAKIVFFRATNLGGAVQSWVCEAVEGEPAYVAIVSAKAKIAHFTTPGKHTYMTGGENCELLEADFEGGKTYYTYVSPRMGFWKARFVFVPVTKEQLASEEFRKDLAWCEWRESLPEAEAWFRENLPSLREKYNEGRAALTANPAEGKFLHPEDGSPIPIF